MLKDKKYNIYSIQINPKQSGLINIETVILKGLYRFSILGISPKFSSDIKDRVYSALRTQKLINLKSDNKKITVNLLPNDVEKKTNIYDLGIAVSCLFCMDHVQIEEDMLVIGELSILGNIIASRILLSSIYQAIENKIKIIVCPYSDIKNIDSDKYRFISLIKKHNINFIVGDTLNEIIQNIKNKDFYKFTNTQSGEIITKKSNPIFIENNHILKVILGLCTKRNIFIENKQDSYIKKFINNLIYYNNKLDNCDVLKLADILKKDDDYILHNHLHETVGIIDSQTQEIELQTLLDKTFFGFNIIENFITIKEESWYIIKNKSRSSIISFYNSCICGNNNIFFNKYDSRCLCLQRNIIRYRQKLKKLENGFFDFYINNIEDIITSYTPEDYININILISGFKKDDLSEVVLTQNIRDILIGYNGHEKKDLDNIIRLAKDIRKFYYIINKSPLILTKDDIDLAIDLLKKDF